jgi:hypothetical protein
VQRVGLIASIRVEEYCKALEARFRPLPLEAFAKFNIIHYLVKDYKNRHSIIEFIITFESYTKVYRQELINRDTIKFGIVIYIYKYT